MKHEEEKFEECNNDLQSAVENVRYHYDKTQPQGDAYVIVLRRHLDTILKAAEFILSDASNHEIFDYIESLEKERDINTETLCETVEILGVHRSEWRNASAWARSVIEERNRLGRMVDEDTDRLLEAKQEADRQREQIECVRNLVTDAHSMGLTDISTTALLKALTGTSKTEFAPEKEDIREKLDWNAIWKAVHDCLPASLRDEHGPFAGEWIADAMVSGLQEYRLQCNQRLHLLDGPEPLLEDVRKAMDEVRRIAADALLPGQCGQCNHTFADHYPTPQVPKRGSGPCSQCECVGFRFNLTEDTPEAEDIKKDNEE